MDPDYRANLRWDAGKGSLPLSFPLGLDGRDFHGDSLKTVLLSG